MRRQPQGVDVQDPPPRELIPPAARSPSAAR
jgi:hypothetical protein